MSQSVKDVFRVGNPLVSLFGLFVARGGKKRGNRRTDRRTDRQTNQVL